MKKDNLEKIVFIKFGFTFVVLLAVILGIFAYVRNIDDDSEYEVSISTGIFDSLDVLTEDEALAQTPTQVVISNENDEELEYNLYFIVDDKTTIDTSYIRVNFNGLTYNLGEMNFLQVDSKKYYFLYNDTITAESEDYFDSYVWIDSSYTLDHSNAKIYINFGTL